MSSLDKIKTLIPLEELEPGALNQIFENAKLDFVKKMAIMPDCHQGYDLPIGAVALTDNVISPSYVGYDIGCGMCYINTCVPVDEIFKDDDAKRDLYNKIVENIPSGFSGHSTPRDYYKFRSASGNKSLTNSAGQKMLYQLGSLGSGNHFIEIGKSRSGHVCITIHSGSRRGGWEIGSWYMKQGRFFELDSDLGQAYIADMGFALQYALDNRMSLMEQVLEQIGFDDHGKFTLLNTVVNENHNHAVITKDGVLHRKGATPADEMQTGIIPANMRDGVYITMGLGNNEYLSSASHGCGRTMGRNQAKKTLDYEKFKHDMANIVASTDKGLLDEAPDAYKDVNMVIGRQDNVVIKIIDFVEPLINVKGI